MKGRLLFVVCLALAVVVSPAVEPRDVRAALTAIHEDLAALRFEQALAEIEALLAEPALREAERVETLVLRAEAHAARGDLGAAEKDYREILALRPGFEPAESLTSAKAMARFHKVRKSMVGIVRLEMDPPDAAVTVDGREAVWGPGQTMALLAGTRNLTASRRGFDSTETQVEVVADQAVPLKVQLTPNSRTVVIRTEPEGVTVRLDGVVMGETRRSKEADGPAELAVEGVSLGEHVFELSKPCHNTETLRDLLTIDLLERSPKAYGTIALEPLRARLSLRGGPKGGEVVINGSPAGPLPQEPVSLCPGQVPVEVHAGGRAVFRTIADLEPDVETVLDVVPRPNAVLLGPNDWPPGLGSLGASFSSETGVSLPHGVDVTTPAGWASVPLPPDTDLAVALVPPVQGESVERWILYSPILGTVERVDPALDGRHPGWQRTILGVRLADSRLGASARVVEVLPGSPAAAAGILPGDRILDVGERKVASANEAVEAIAARPAGTPIPIRIQSTSGTTRALDCSGSSSPWLREDWTAPGSAAIAAAWASVDAATLPADEAPTVLANLAWLLSRAGRHAQAVSAWRRVQWGERTGLGTGTVAYFLGRELEALGREDEARESYRKAANSVATSQSDEGPVVAPAARDHLADLGVATAH